MTRARIAIWAIPTIYIITALLPQRVAAAPDWQIHADWCASQDHGSSHHAWHRTCQVADQFNSVLACQRDAGKQGPVDQVLAAGAAAVNAYMKNRPGTEACAYEHRQSDDWKIHANWCANVDKGSSHDKYIDRCRQRGVDQFTAVSACQQDAGNDHWLEGGSRELVNSYMADKIPSDCTPPVTPPPKQAPRNPNYEQCGPSALLNFDKRSQCCCVCNADRSKYSVISSGGNNCSYACSRETC